MPGSVGFQGTAEQGPGRALGEMSRAAGAAQPLHVQPVAIPVVKSMLPDQLPAQ